MLLVAMALFALSTWGAQAALGNVSEPLPLIGCLDGVCAGHHKKCGGSGFNESIACCEEDQVCIAKHFWHAQCLSVEEALYNVDNLGWDGRVLDCEDMPADIVSAPLVSSSACEDGGCVGLYETCFGSGYDTSKPCCQMESMPDIACHVKHDNYAQCLTADMALLNVQAGSWDGRTLSCEAMPADVPGSTRPREGRPTQVEYSDCEDDSCVMVFDKCGGTNITTSVPCCEPDNMCIVKNYFYAQCLTAEDARQHVEQLGWDGRVLPACSEMPMDAFKGPADVETMPIEKNDDSARRRLLQVDCEDDTCVEEFEKCGGKNMTSFPCCDPELACVVKNYFYAQCLTLERAMVNVEVEGWDGRILECEEMPLDAAKGPEDSPMLPTGRRLLQANCEDDTCIEEFEKCGGKNMTSLSCCNTELSCVVKNYFYAQCLTAERAAANVEEEGWDGRILECEEMPFDAPKGPKDAAMQMAGRRLLQTSGYYGNYGTYGSYSSSGYGGDRNIGDYSTYGSHEARAPRGPRAPRAPRAPGSDDRIGGYGSYGSPLNGYVLGRSYGAGSYSPLSDLPVSYGAGSYSAGSYGTGSYGVGSYGVGSYAVGSYAVGSYAVGSYAVGSYAVGSYAGSYGSQVASSYGAGSYGTGSYASSNGGYSSFSSGGGYSGYGGGSRGIVTNGGYMYAMTEEAMPPVAPGDGSFEALGYGDMEIIAIGGYTYGNTFEEREIDDTNTPSEACSTCGAIFDQCGGGDMLSTCCAPGLTCIKKHWFYAQCLKPDRAARNVADFGWDGEELVCGEPMTGPVPNYAQPAAGLRRLLAPPHSGGVYGSYGGMPAAPHDQTAPPRSGGRYGSAYGSTSERDTDHIPDLEETVSADMPVEVPATSPTEALATVEIVPPSELCGNCGGIFEVCGHRGMMTRCCAAGLQCFKKNGFFAQCLRPDRAAINVERFGWDGIVLPCGMTIADATRAMRSRTVRRPRMRGRSLLDVSTGSYGYGVSYRGSGGDYGATGRGAYGAYAEAPRGVPTNVAAPALEPVDDDVNSISSLCSACKSMFETCGVFGAIAECCEEGSQCLVKNAFYAQCMPDNQAVESGWDGTVLACGDPMPGLFSRRSMAAADDSCGHCLEPFEKCGGEDMATVCCAEGLMCIKKNDYYAQCLTPKRAERNMREEGWDGAVLHCGEPMA